MKLTSGTCAWIERGGHNAAKLVITSDESPLSDVQQLTKHSHLAPKILRCGAVRCWLYKRNSGRRKIMVPIRVQGPIVGCLGGWFLAWRTSRD